MDWLNLPFEWLQDVDRTMKRWSKRRSQMRRAKLVFQVQPIRPAFI